VIGDGARIVAPEELDGIARWARAVLEAPTRWQVEVLRPSEAPAPGPGGEIRLRLGEPATSGACGSGCVAGPESYRLVIGPGGVEVVGGSPAGVFYGLESLRQLLPARLLRQAPATGARTEGPVELGGVEIVDGPRFSWRGVLLDVARHFMPKSFLLRLVDLIAFHKCNVLHLHLTDDQGWRMPIAAWPHLVEIGAFRRESSAGHLFEGRFDGCPHGGYYTKADIAEIVAYAAERFVMVLPEIDMPGHMAAAIASYPGLGTGEAREVRTSWGISSHVLSLEEGTIEFCTGVLDEVMELFPAPYVHIGGDECPTDEWESTTAAAAIMAREGLSRPRELQGWFTKQIGDHLEASGRRLVGWDEILEGGAPDGAVVMAWRGEEAGLAALRAGHDVVMAPEDRLYFDWASSDDDREPLAICGPTTLEHVYSYEPVPAGRRPREDPDPSAVRESSKTRPGHVLAGHVLAGSVLGAQCQLWTEYVSSPEHAEYMYFPRLCAFAEVVWSPVGERSYGELSGRLAPHLERLDALGVNYRPLDGPTPGQARHW
ncbi:MAG: beta-N-acetylhexosaminidase, partial [Acidimicrobiales bacterium]